MISPPVNTRAAIRRNCWVAPINVAADPISTKPTSVSSGPRTGAETDRIAIEGGVSTELAQEEQCHHTSQRAGCKNGCDG